MHTIPGRPKKQYDVELIRRIHDDYEVMTGKQVAARYNVSLSTVNRYVRMYDAMIKPAGGGANGQED